MLRAGGWEPGRAVDRLVADWETRLRPDDGEMPLAAKRTLIEFGALTVGGWGPGRDRARGNIEFDPMLAAGEAADRQRGSGLRLFPLGEVDGGHGFLFAAANGEVWAWTLDDVLRQLGLDIDEALDRQLLGKRARREVETSDTG